MKSVLRNVIRPVIGKSSGSSWTPLSPLGGETPNFWYKAGTRNGLTLPDSVNPGTGDASILLPYLYKPLYTQHAICMDNGGLNIGNTNSLTLFMRVNSESTNKSFYFDIGGKDVSGFLNGCYYFIQNIGDGHLYFAVASSGSALFIDTGIDFTGLSWPMLVLQIDVTNKIIKCFINGTQYGGNQSYSGSFAALDSKYGFILGTRNDSTGYGAVLAAFTSATSYKDVGVLHRLLSSTELTNLNSDIFPVDCAAHWICAGGSNYITDITGNGYDLLGVNLYNKDNTKFSVSGSHHNLINGYTLWSNGFDDCYVSNKLDGTEYTPANIPVSFSRMSFHAGSVTDHNLANSVIAFKGAQRDRSDATIFNQFARHADSYYDSTSSTTKKYWHISELNNLQHQARANPGYKGLDFVNTFGASYKLSTRLKLELFSYNTNKIGADYAKLMEYACDYVYVDTYENDWIYWKYDSRNIVATRDLKVLRYSSGTLYLSIDGGITYPYSKAIAGLTHIKMAYICANGDMAFASIDKIYRSTDNLSTVTEIHPLDINGDPYTPMLDANYDQVGISNYMDNVLGDPIIWGNYQVINMTGGTLGDNINIWYTIDNFATIKSCHYFDPLDTSNNTGHVHNSTKHPDGSFWVHCGDGVVNSNARWLKGIYTPGTDSWSWNVIVHASNASLYSASGIGFKSGNVYWCPEVSTYFGILKSAESDLFTESKVTQAFKTKYNLCFLLMEANGELIAAMANTPSWVNQVVISKNAEVAIKGNALYDSNIPNNFGFWTIRPKNANGWFFMQIHEYDESYCNAGVIGGNQVSDNGVMWVKMK